MSTITSWSAGFELVRSAAALGRGTEVGRDASGALDFVPHTSTEDVAALAAHVGLYCVYVDAALARAWFVELTALLAASRIPEAPYRRNREFWAVLMQLADGLDCADIAPPPVAAWRELALRFVGPLRNADATATTQTRTIEFPSGKKADDMVNAMLIAFREVRGADRIVMGAATRSVPRTTNADVIRLADYWQHALATYGNQVPDWVARFTDIPDRYWADVSAGPVLDAWKRAVANVDRDARGGDPTATYAHNAEFWPAMLALGNQIAAMVAAPMKFDIAVEAAKDAILDLPANLGKAATSVVNGAWGHLKWPIAVGGALALYLLLGGRR